MRFSAPLGVDGPTSSRPSTRRTVPRCRGRRAAAPPAGARAQVDAPRASAALVRVRAGDRPVRPAPKAGHLPGKLAGGLSPSGRSGAGSRDRAMEDTSRTREPRARPRARDPDLQPRADRDRHPERPRDRAGDRRTERHGGERRDGDGDRDGGRGRDPRQDRHRVGDPRPAEQRVWEKSRPNRARDGARRPSWDAAPPPRPAPWETPEPPPHRKEDFGRRGPER